MVSTVTGMLVQANKAIVGANAFAHESGIHQDGVLKNRRTYEIMDAESIGLTDNNIVLGKLSGRHAFRSRLIELGYNLDDSETNAAFARFKELADKKKEISNADLESIVNDEIQMTASHRFQLVHCQVLCGDKQIPTATIGVSDASKEGNEVVTLSMTGTGPVDAAYKALRALTVQDIKLLEYTVSSVTAGIDAFGEMTVRCSDITNGRVGTGRSANTDVIVASAQAYLNAINRLVSQRGMDLPKHPQFSTPVK